MQTRKNIAVTIDGPAGAGKTTAARALAEAMPRFRYVDTGAFYRMIACYRKEHDSADWLDGADGAMKAVPGDGGSQEMMLLRDGRWDRIPEDVLRSPETSEQASIVSTDPRVRALANGLIRAYASGLDVVMEGRDTGTAVLPDADFKFYLSADQDVRARRRQRDLQAAGIVQKLDVTRADLERRDDRDTHREADPLRVADGAIEIDNTGMDAGQTVRAMMSHIERALASRGG